MRKVLPVWSVLIGALCWVSLVQAQTLTLRGTVSSAATQERATAVSVIVKGTQEGTYTDDRGAFTLTTSQRLPLTLVFSSIGFETREVNVTNASDAIEVFLAPAVSLGQEVVVSATRTPARILESPVTVERVSATMIRQAPQATYYDIITNLKGVDVVASSLTFKTPTTRGFNTSGSVRVLQIMDGMDNQAPGLNFSVGSVIGLNELDVESVELLSGASSALYGPGGINGTILINGKNPFKYQGLSFQVKTGVMHTDRRNRDLSGYHNWAVRWAKQVSNRFAFKIGSELIQAKDWVADDMRNYRRLGGASQGQIVPVTRETDPNYDGVNTYGDETTINLRTAVLNPIAQAVPYLADLINSLPQTIDVSRTGYREADIVDPNTKVFKFSGALHYKLTNKIEAILAGHWGTGTTVYTGAQRYSLRDFKIGQYKFELQAKNWFMRAFTTQENSGDSHDLTVTTRLFNEQWKPSPTWYQQYGFAYLNAKMAGRPDLEAHNIARGVADQGRPAPRSTEFNRLFDRVRSVPIPQGGLFLDRSDMYWVEGQYNFQDVIKWADVLIGGNWRQFVLNSQGTLFMKEAELIRINELGGYIQVGKEIIPNLLRLTGSMRYDKNQNFDGRFTPRLTAVLKPAKDHNIRFSYQTAYRFPSTQQQWIDLNVGTGRLIGENRRLWEKYNLLENAPFNPLNLQERLTYRQTRPESVTSYEVGYKSLISNKLLIDAYVYYGIYENFISRRDAVQFSGGAPGQGTATGFSIVVNAPGQVKTNGWGLGLDYLLPANYRIGVNVSSDELRDVPTGFRSFFNTPKYRSNVSFGNDGMGTRRIFGFNVVWRWQDAFFWDSDFIAGELPAYHTVDAALSFRLPKQKSLVKLGANNLLNQYYRTAIANPSIGGLYYVSFAYNVL